jgi:hypothetical protein
MRIPGLRRDRGNEAYAQPPSQIICPVCGLRNDSMARFCRNCGLPLGAPRDPVRGTTSRRADLPSEHGTGIAAIVGLVVAVLVLAGAGWLILRGNNGGAAVLPTSTPAISLAAGATPRPTTRPLLPSRVPANPDGSPAVATPRTRTPQPSDASGANASAGPLVADTDFTCDLGSFQDPSNGSWSVSEARWGARAKWDELTLVLTREKGKGTTRFDVEAMSAQEAAQISGLDPARDDRVILITLDGDVIMGIPPVVADMGLRTLDFLNVETANDTTYAVVGVNTDGCYRLSAPAWKRGDSIAVGDTVNVLLDVKYR